MQLYGPSFQQWENVRSGSRKMAWDARMTVPGQERQAYCWLSQTAAVLPARSPSWQDSMTGRTLLTCHDEFSNVL
jgi:hypothetical protein